MKASTAGRIIGLLCIGACLGFAGQVVQPGGGGGAPTTCTAGTYACLSTANVFTNATGNTFGTSGGNQITKVYAVAGGTGRFRVTDDALAFDVYPNNIQINTNFIYYTTNASYQAWATNFTERMRVSATGGVTIGDATFAGADPGLNNLSVQANAKAATFSTATNCSSTASPAVCAAAPAGKVQVAAAATTLQINTTAVTANSECSFTYSTVGITAPVNIALLIPPYISAITGGTSFTITLPVAPGTNPVNILYSCVN